MIKHNAKISDNGNNNTHKHNSFMSESPVFQIQTGSSQRSWERLGV